MRMREVWVMKAEESVMIGMKRDVVVGVDAK